MGSRDKIFNMSVTVSLLHAIAFVDLLAVGLIIPLLPNKVRSLGGNEIHVGLLGSLYAGFQLGSGPLIGSLSDLKGRKLILAVTLIISGLAYAYLGITDSIFVILVIRSILGVFKQTQVLTRALVPDYEKDQCLQGNIYGKMAAISGVGITLGPVIGGHIVEDYPNLGFTFIATVVGSCFTLNACIVYFNLPNIKPTRRKSNIELETNLIHRLYRNVHQSFIELYNIEWFKYWEIFLFKALVGFAMGTYYSNYALYLKTQYTLSPKYVGYVISFQGIVGSICSYSIGFINSFYVNDQDYSIRNFHVFILLSVALIGMILSYHILVYSFCLIPLAIGNAIGRLVTLEMVLKKCGKDHTGKLIGASNSIRSLTGVVAPMVAGIIGQYIGVKYVIYVSLFSAITGVVLSYRHQIKLKKE